MKLYDFVCVNELVVKELIKYGVMPIDIHNQVDVYKRYLEERKECKQMQAVENVSEDTKQSSWKVYRIIKKMESEL